MAGGTNTGGNPIVQNTGGQPNIDVTSLVSELTSLTQVLRTFTNQYRRQISSGSGSSQQSSTSRRNMSFDDFSDDLRNAGKSIIALSSKIKESQASVRSDLSETVGKIQELSRSTSTTYSTVQNAMLERQKSYQLELENHINEIQRTFNAEMERITRDLAGLGISAEDAQKQLELHTDASERVRTNQARLSEITAKLATALSTGATDEATRLMQEQTEIRNIIEAQQQIVNKTKDGANIAERQNKAMRDAENNIKSINQKYNDMQKNLESMTSRISDITSSGARAYEDFASRTALLGEGEKTERERYNEERDAVIAQLGKTIDGLEQEITRLAGTIDDSQKAIEDADRYLAQVGTGADANTKAIVELERERAAQERLHTQKSTEVAGETTTQRDAREAEASDIQKGIDDINEKIKKLEDDREKRKKEAEDAKKEAQKIKEDAEKTKKSAEDAENLAKEQMANVKKATYEHEQLAKITKEIKETPNKIFQNLLGWGFNKLIDTLSNGFQSVYDSVERTRNDISARLRLNQGDFTELQEELNEEIKAMGLEGVMSTVDVNEALVSLTSAGITDTDTLKALSLESAKLKASGSSLSLDESLVEKIVTATNKGMKLDEIINILEYSAATQKYAADTFGSDSALINNQLTQLVESQLEMGTARGLTSEEIKRNIGGQAMWAQGLQTGGVDPTVLANKYKDMFEKGILDQDIFGNALINEFSKIGKSIENVDPNEFYQMFISLYQKATSGVRPELLPYVSSAYETGLSSADARNLQILNTKDITNSINTSTSKLDEIMQDTNTNLEQYYSTTRVTEKKAENTMAEHAILAEQYYRGDMLFKAVTEPISGLLNNIITLLATNIFSGISGIGGVGGAGATGTGFLSGVTLPLGSIANAVGGIAGVGMAGYSVIKNINKYDGAEAAEHIFSDKTYGAGIGAMIGTAVAGPIGAAVGGFLGGQVLPLISEKAEEFGEWIAGHDDTVDAQLEAAQKLQDASDALHESSNLLSESAQEDQINLDNTKNIFETFNINEKKEFLKREGLLKQDNSNNLTEEQINQKFMDWVDEQQKEIEKKKLKSQKSSLTEPILGTTESILGEEESEFSKRAAKEMSKNDIYDTLKNADDEMLSYIFEYGTEEDKKNYHKLKETGHISDTSYVTTQEQSLAQLVQDYKSKKYQESQIKKAYQSKAGYDLLSSMSTYKDVSGATDYLSAAQSYYEEEIASGAMSSSDVEQIAAQMEMLEANKAAYDEASEQFKTKWESIKETYPYAGQLELITKYNEVYKTSDVSNAIQGYSNTGYPVDDRGFPILKYETEGGILYDPSLWEGKFRSGISYVPYDEYPALLHEGERVLTAKEADAYNELSSYAVSQITNNEEYGISHLINSGSAYSTIINSKSLGTDKLDDSINNQTESISKKLDDVIQLLKILISGNANSSVLASINKNVRRMNSNFMELNTI